MEIQAAAAAAAAAATDRNKGLNWGGAAATETQRDLPYAGFDRGSFLAWQDLRVVLPNFGKGPTKRLLNGLNGYAEPGRIMAIMGPSGSGKSTLLDALAGTNIFTPSCIHSIVSHRLKDLFYISNSLTSFRRLVI